MVFFEDGDYDSGGSTDLAALYEDAYGEVYDPNNSTHVSKAQSLDAAATHCKDVVSWDHMNPTVGSHPQISPYADTNDDVFDDLPDFLICDEGTIGPLTAADLKSSCEEFYSDLLFENLYEAYRQSAILLRNRYESEYYVNCFDNILKREKLINTYEIDEYAYTLYYYDQADNLVKTVPPVGVQGKILIEDPDALPNPITELSDVDAYREGTSSVFKVPDYDSSSTWYTYNSF